MQFMNSSYNRSLPFTISHPCIVDNINLLISLILQIIICYRTLLFSANYHHRQSLWYIIWYLTNDVDHENPLMQNPVSTTIYASLCAASCCIFLCIPIDFRLRVINYLHVIQEVVKHHECGSLTLHTLIRRS